MLSGPVVIEAVSHFTALGAHVPHAVFEMYGYAKGLESVPSLFVSFVSLINYPTVGGVSSAGPSQQETSRFFSSLP